MGKGVPGPDFVIHPILLGAQNYGDLRCKICQNQKFLLIDLLLPKLTKLNQPISLEQQKWTPILFFPLKYLG